MVSTPGATTSATVSHPAPSPLKSLPGLLAQALNELLGMGPSFRPVGERLQTLHQRRSEQRFHLAVLGQFKRGKSTLLNALLGLEVLPTSVVPLTAIPTFLLADATSRARVTFETNDLPEEFECSESTGLHQFLTRFVTEEANPKNRLKVAQVEVYLPASILEKGVVLIDTPGIGSTYRHNTEAALNFLPQCDAALFVVSADPPITEVEVDFLCEVCSKVSRLFVVLNKVDYLSAQELNTATTFLRDVLKEQAELPEDTELFCISARQGLESKIKSDLTGWRSSGMAILEEYLTGFLAKGKSEALNQAVASKAADALGEALLSLELRIRALELPANELDQRLKTFAEKLAEARQQEMVAGDLLAGDRRRLHHFLEGQAAGLRETARVTLEKFVSGALADANGPGNYEAAAQTVLSQEIPVMFEHELGVLSREVDIKITEMMQRHEVRADDLINELRLTAAELFEIPYHPSDRKSLYEVQRKPYWVTTKWNSSVSPIPPAALDAFLPGGLRRKRIQKRLQAQIQDLVLYNVENVRWATLQNVDQAFRTFESELKMRLSETVAATQGAIKAAANKRKEHSEEVTDEVSRLKTALTKLNDWRWEILDRDTFDEQ